ncbi:MAG: hypothetical protein AAGE52_34050 [Myxococcota bacterium]
MTAALIAIQKAHEDFVREPGPESVEALVRAAVEVEHRTPTDFARWIEDASVSDIDAGPAAETYFVGGREALRGWSTLASAQLFGVAAFLAHAAGNRTRAREAAFQCAQVFAEEGATDAKALMQLCADLDEGRDAPAADRLDALLWLALCGETPEALDEALRRCPDDVTTQAAHRLVHGGDLREVEALLSTQTSRPSVFALMTHATVANAYFGAGQMRDGLGWLERGAQLPFAAPSDPDRDVNAPFAFFTTKARVSLLMDIAEASARLHDNAAVEHAIERARALQATLPSACPADPRLPLTPTSVPSRDEDSDDLRELANELLAEDPDASLLPALQVLASGDANGALEVLLETQDAAAETRKSGQQLALSILRVAGPRVSELRRRWQSYL